MTDQLSDAEVVRRLQVLKASKNRLDAAKKLGIGSSAMNNTENLAAARGLTAETVIQDEKEKLRAKVKTLEAALRASQREQDSAEEIRRKIYELAARRPEPPQWILTETGASGKRGTPCTIWSDWHRGETVRKEEVGGLNEFTTEIHDARVKRLVNTTCDIAFNHMGRADTVYPGIVVMLGGDFINGDIHAELIENADRTTQQNINELTDVIAAALEALASKFGKVYAPAVVGNHGRGTLKPRMKGRVITSHEWNIYCNLARYFKRDKHIVIDVADQADISFTVVGHRYLLTHGDSLGVRGGDGIIGAIGPIMRGAIKVGLSEAQVGNNVDTTVMGHWHQPLWLPKTIVNNALKGYDEYARLMLRAPYTVPSQLLWWTHPDHGITCKWEVFLEGKKQAAPAVERGLPGWL